MDNAMPDCVRPRHFGVDEKLPDADDGFPLAEYSISIREDRTQYGPNLSEEEPLFSARTFDPDSASVMHVPGKHRAHKVQRQSRTSGMSSPCSLI
jgi:hypothetical protein